MSSSHETVKNLETDQSHWAHLLIWLGSGSSLSATSTPPSRRDESQPETHPRQSWLDSVSSTLSLSSLAETKPAEDAGEHGELEADMRAAYLARIKRFSRILSHVTSLPVHPTEVAQTTSFVWLKSLVGLAPPSDEDPDAFKVDLDEAFASSDDLRLKDPKFLGYISKENLLATMQKHRIIDALAKIAYTDPALILDNSTDVHRLSLTDRCLFETGELQDEKSLAHSQFLVDLYMRRRRNYTLDNMLSYQLLYRLESSNGWEGMQTKTGTVRSPYMTLGLATDVKKFFEVQWPLSAALSKRGQKVEVAEIAWIQMQNPLAPLDKDRLLFPGQRYTSLGMSKEIGGMIYDLATESPACDGLMNCPFSWVNAFYYIKLGHRALNPAFQAYIEFTTAVMEPIIKSQGLAFVAWAFTNGHVKREGQTEIWNPEELIIPSGSKVFTVWFDSNEYKTLLERSRKEMSQASLYIDMEEATELWSKSKDPIWQAKAERLG